MKADHRGLTDVEKLKRDRWEKSRIDAGKELPYTCSPKQIAQREANIKANGGTPSAPGTPRDPKSPKGKGKEAEGGKGAGRPCWHFQETKECPYGSNCKFKKNTPGHP